MGGIVGETRPGNTRLVEYGIQNEKSDYRAHVSVIAKRVYFFPTQIALDAVIGNRDQDGNYLYRKVPVNTNGIVTAEGFLVPPRDIDECQNVEIPEDIFEMAEFRQFDTTSEKGRKALVVVKEMLKRQLLEMSLDVKEISDEDMQVSGADILVQLQARIQVKCDWNCGERKFGGTGNLFLQVAECNPWGQH